MSDIKDLKFDDKNFNKHTEFGMGLLEKSLNKFGAGRSILVDKDNNIIAGNGIVEAAANAGLTKTKVVETTGDELVVVKRTDVALNSAQGREMALADNATAQADLEWDEENLKSEFDDETLHGWIGNQDWMDNDTDEVVEDEAPEVNESEPADSELGKVYQLGEHRLMCGDSTDAGNVAILMDGQKADMVFTDPPYGMNLDTDWSSAHGAFGHGLKHDKVIGDNDDFTPDLIKTVFDNFGYCKEIFMWGCDYYAELIENRNHGSIIVWDKSIDEQADKMFGSNFELCWSKNRHKRELARVKWKGIFGVADDQKNRVHPTQKPAALAVWFFKKYGGKDDAVVDLFGGSGSTLIACEQLGRKCYMMELDPKYCDVIRKRYWKFKTGSEEGWQDGTKAE